MAKEEKVEFEGEVHNCVLVIQKFLDVDRQHAVRVVNNLMTSRLQQFEHIIDTELPFVANEFGLGADARHALDAYLVGLQDWMAGILTWHMVTGRYGESAVRRRYRRPLRWAGGPTGLGTSAPVLNLLSGARAPA